MLDFAKKNVGKIADFGLQFPFNNFIPMATYWVPDLPNIKGISGQPLCSVFIFANVAWYTWSNKHINKLA